MRSSLQEGAKDNTDDTAEVGLLLPAAAYPATMVDVPLMLPRLEDVARAPRMGEWGVSGDRASRGGALTGGPACGLQPC